MLRFTHFLEIFGKKKVPFWVKNSVYWARSALLHGIYCILHWVEFANLRKNDAFVGKIVIRVWRIILWPFLPSPKGCQLLPPWIRSIPSTSWRPSERTWSWKKCKVLNTNFSLMLLNCILSGYFCLDDYHTKVFVIKHFKAEFEAGKYHLQD